MDRSVMVVFMQENPNVKITHSLFSNNEYIYQKEDGKVYDENGYLFEDWYSEGIGQHNGIRMRIGGNWDDGWEVINDENMCETLSKTTSGKKYLYNKYCRTCQGYLAACPYL